MAWNNADANKKIIHQNSVGPSLVNIKELQEFRNNAKDALPQPLQENETLKCNFHITILFYIYTESYWASAYDMVSIYEALLQD